jgi:uncharacterized protein YjbI with pentapeptide repeats
MKKKIIISVLLALVFGGLFAMNNIQIMRIKALFDNTNQLNTFIEKQQPCRFMDINIEGNKLHGMKLINSTLEDSTWKQIDAKNSALENVTIKNCTLEKIDFTKSNITNVTFEHVILDGVIFDSSQLKNIVFKNCEIWNGSFYKLINSDANIDTSKLENNYFEDAEFELTIKNSNVKDSIFAGLKTNNFHMQGGKLIHANFDNSQIDEFKLDKDDAVGCYAVGKSKEIIINDCKIAFDLSGTTFDIINITNSELTNFTVYELTANRVSIRNCKGSYTNDFGFFKAKLNKLTINNCEADAIDFRQANIDELNLTDVSFKNSFSDHMHVNTAKLDGVEMSGDIDLSGAYIEKLYTRNAKNGHAKIKFDGSNLEYSDYYGLKLKGINPNKNYEGWWFSQARN